MRSPVPHTILVLAALAPAAATGQAALSFERAAGLGLKPQSAEAFTSGHAFGEAAVRAWQGLPAGDYALYGGDAPRLGLRTGESHAGIVYSASGWGTSFEAATQTCHPLRRDATPSPASSTPLSARAEP